MPVPSLSGGRRGGAVFEAPAPHDHGVGRGRLIHRLGSARPPRGLHALGVAAVEAGAESFADPMELVGEAETVGHGGEDEPAQDASGLPEVDVAPSQLPGGSSQGEPPAQPRRRLRRIGEVVRPAGQQLRLRVTRSSEAAGAGSSRAEASAPTAPRAAASTGAGSSTAPAKRSREPTPLSPRVRIKPVFDYSALSSDDEEEEEE